VSAQRFRATRGGSEVEAIQLVGDDCAKNNAFEIIGWVLRCGRHAHYQTIGMANGRVVVTSSGGEDEEAFPGDWVVRDADGEFSACKADVFAADYELTEAAP
jgi:hypothetical protein